MKNLYFYKLIHLKTGKIYVGIAFSEKRNSDTFFTEKGYKTSSNIIHKLIKEDGLQGFKIARIKHFESKNYLINFETRYLRFHYRKLGRDSFAKLFINKNFSKCFLKTEEQNEKHSQFMKVSNPMFLEAAKQKIQKHKIKYWSHQENKITASDKTKLFFSKEENRKRHSDIVKNQWNEDRRKRYSENNPAKRQSVKDKVREKRKGMLWWNNGHIRTMSKECPGSEWIQGYKIGV